MRHKVIEIRQELFNHNEHEVSKRWAFEEAVCSVLNTFYCFFCVCSSPLDVSVSSFQIKRPYFHVKALEKTQLSNWREYLEFEMENGTPERVVVLFERCLIACALYEEFWIKVTGVRNVGFGRASSLHFPIHDDNHIESVKRPALFACNVDM